MDRASDSMASHLPELSNDWETNGRMAAKKQTNNKLSSCILNYDQATKVAEITQDEQII